MIEWTVYIKIFTALLAIVNPLGVIPVFVSLTGAMSEQERGAIARTSSIAVAVILIVSTLIGKLLLDFFNISIASFKVGGGILLMLMAIEMMQARHLSKQTPEEAAEAEDKKTIAVVPIAVPLLAGPGAISTVIIFTHGSFRPMHIGLIVISCLLVALATWAALRIASPVSKVLGKTGINVATRLMGLLLAAIAVEFIAGGSAQLLPGLAR